MPTLTRLIVALALVTACFYGAVYAIANFVDPPQREITVPVQLPGSDG
ncbi:MAG: hypothetical protein MUC58_01050 [Rhizobiaceae bacterium]|jgi:hypothetical protein|nr:hypothetical protein [Rhizobiaceae bacterium]